MGGTALGRPAVRLTSAQHAALEVYCREKLRHHFDVMITPAYFRSKDTHGDLDLICAWEGCEVGKFEKGVYQGRVLTVGEEEARGGSVEARRLNGEEAEEAEAEPGHIHASDGATTMAGDAERDEDAQSASGATELADVHVGGQARRGRNGQDGLSRPHTGKMARAMALPDLLDSAVRAFGGREWKSLNNEVTIANVELPLAVFGGVTPARTEGVNGSEEVEAGDDKSAIGGCSEIYGWEHVVRDLRGTQWTARGLSNGVLGRDQYGGSQDHEAFYQVDLILLPPASIPWTQFILSYSDTLIILGAAMRLITPQIVIHATHIGSNWVAYPTYRPIRVPLATDLEAICDWLNLDLTRWREGFEHEQDLYQWIISGGGVLNAAWRKIRRYDPLVYRCGGVGQRRNGAWRRFCAWLEVGDFQFEKTVEEEEECGRGNVLKPGQVDIDPGRPSPVHGLLGRVLDRWGKREEMDTAWKVQREEVRVVWDRKRAKEFANEASEMARIAGGWIEVQGIEDNQPRTEIYQRRARGRGGKRSKMGTDRSG